MPCIACMYPQHSSAGLVFGIRICSPLPLVPLSRFWQLWTMSDAPSVALAVCDNELDAAIRTTTKMFAYLICRSRSGLQWHFGLCRQTKTRTDRWSSGWLLSSRKRLAKRVWFPPIPGVRGKFRLEHRRVTLCLSRLNCGRAVSAVTDIQLKILFAFDRDRRQPGHS